MCFLCLRFSPVGPPNTNQPDENGGFPRRRRPRKRTIKVYTTIMRDKRSSPHRERVKTKGDVVEKRLAAVENRY